MFFDRLLKLQSLKFRLLGSTSFAQLYSAERLPLHKFRKEGAMLSPLIAGLLGACGGGGGGVIKEQLGLSISVAQGDTVLAVGGKEFLRLQDYADALTHENFHITWQTGEGEPEKILSTPGTYKVASNTVYHLENVTEIKGDVKWASDGRITLTLTDQNGAAYVLRGAPGVDLRENPPVLLKADGSLIFISAINVPPVTAGEDGKKVTGTNVSDDLQGSVGEESDELDGGKGRDKIDGGQGNDRLTGGDGPDVFTFTGDNFGKDYIKDYRNIDEIRFTAFTKEQIQLALKIHADDHVEVHLTFTKPLGDAYDPKKLSVIIEKLDGADLNRIQVFDKDGVQVEYDFGDFRSEANSFTATGDLPVTFYGGGGKDTLKGAGGPAHLFGGKGHDTLTGGSNDDVLYGDKGRDVLTGGDGKDVFVAQPIDAAAVKSAVGARGREGSPLSKFYDLVEDFELGKDKIGIFDFKAVQDLAKENDDNIERARQRYWEQLEQRAKVDTKSQLDIMLDDLGYYFKPLRLTKFPDRGEDSGIIHWVLVHKNNAKKKGDDTALLMFHSDDFASFRNNPSNPFFSSYEENQVILDYEDNPMMIFEFV